MIKTSKFSTIIYTDHSTTIQITSQTSMTTTTSLVRLNQRLQRSSQYLSTFKLEVRHKPGKVNVVPDALSRLETSEDTSGKSVNNSKIQIENAKQNEIQTLAFPTSIVQLSTNFLNRLKGAYQRDIRCKKIIKVIQKNDEQEANGSDLPFQITEGILYAKADDIHAEARPVIPREMAKEVFEMAYDQLGHLDFTRTHERLSGKFLILDLPSN